MKKSTKFETFMDVFKILIELIILGLLIATIIYLFKAEDGIISETSRNPGQEKLDAAIRKYAAADDMELDEAIKEIEGFEELTIDENTGIYTVKIDGQIYTVIKHEGGKSDEDNSNEIIEKWVDNIPHFTK